MGGRTCAICTHELETSTAPVRVEFREGVYEVAGVPHRVCPACGELSFSFEVAKELQSRAAEMARREKGLLTPGEIRQLRKDLSLRQEDLEKVLRAGPKTVTRWEKGTVFQSAAADQLMRAIWAFPWLVAFLLSQQTSAACGSSFHRQAILENPVDAAWTPVAGAFLKAVDNDFSAAA